MHEVELPGGSGFPGKPAGWLVVTIRINPACFRAIRAFGASGDPELFEAMEALLAVKGVTEVEDTITLEEDGWFLHDGIQQRVSPSSDQRH